MLMAEIRRTNVRFIILSTKKDTGNESSESRAGERAPFLEDKEIKKAMRERGLRVLFHF
jgi:hypothetical protein